MWVSKWEWMRREYRRWWHFCRMKMISLIWFDPSYNSCPGTSQRSTEHHNSGEGAWVGTKVYSQGCCLCWQYLVYFNVVFVLPWKLPDTQQSYMFLVKVSSIWKDETILPRVSLCPSAGVLCRRNWAYFAMWPLIYLFFILSINLFMFDNKVNCRYKHTSG